MINQKYRTSYKHLPNLLQKTSVRKGKHKTVGKLLGVQKRPENYNNKMQCYKQNDYALIVKLLEIKKFKYTLETS